MEISQKVRLLTWTWIRRTSIRKQRVEERPKENGPILYFEI